MQAKKYQGLKVEKKANKILRDTSRVITSLHLPDEKYRIPKIIQRIMSLSETEAENLITQIMVDFLIEQNHRNSELFRGLLRWETIHMV